MCVHTYIYMYTSHGQVAHVLRAITMICPFEQKMELRVAMRGTVLFIPAFLAWPDEWNWDYLITWMTDFKTSGIPRIYWESYCKHAEESIHKGLGNSLADLRPDIVPCQAL